MAGLQTSTEHLEAIRHRLDSLEAKLDNLIERLSRPAPRKDG